MNMSQERGVFRAFTPESTKSSMSERKTEMPCPRQKRVTKEKDREAKQPLQTIDLGNEAKWKLERSRKEEKRNTRKSEKRKDIRSSRTRGQARLLAHDCPLGPKLACFLSTPAKLP